MPLQNTLQQAVSSAVLNHYQVTLNQFEFQATRQDFEGDITLVVFPLLRSIKGNPIQIGETIGAYLKENLSFIVDYNVVKGFLNLVISDVFYHDEFYKMFQNEDYGIKTANPSDKAVMVEYSSPNTNKPLHLGHIRNNLLGYSVAKIIEASGKKVIKTQIINDRGIHICKSMVAWQKFGHGETPEFTGLKGDKLVGNYYVKFDQEYKKQIANGIAKGLTEDESKKQAPILIEAQNMLLKWEAGNSEVVALWKKMNQWVYDGFKVSYQTLGVDFDINYYESNTYLLGKDVVNQGLANGIFYKKADGSVWIDLTEDGLDEKIVLRSDGTSVYMTQDFGTAIQRFKDFDIDTLIYTVGNEQDYHFKVLFLILKKLGFSWAENLYHLSYGMVDLPSGKMKSREGTVVDADELVAEMIKTAKDISEELGKLGGYSTDEKENLYKTIGLGALKYYILKVDPKKRILFDPKESIDFNGNTGPFIQYTYARIRSILRKADFDYAHPVVLNSIDPKAKELIKHLQLFEDVIKQAAQNQSPALIANYSYDLVKLYNSFYQAVPILGNTNALEKVFFVQLSAVVAKVLKTGFGLLGIAVPKRM